MANTYIFTKEAEGFSLVTNGGQPQSYVDADISTTTTASVLAMRINDQVLRFYPGTDSIKLGGSGATPFSGTPAELWTAISTLIDEQGSVPGSQVTQDSTHRFATDVEKAVWNDKQSNYLLAIQALGSTIKAQTLGLDSAAIATAGALTDGTAVFIAVYLPKGATLTGVKYWQGAQGSFTADNNNEIGLYTYSAGTITRVAVSANDGNIWKATGLSVQSVPFSSTYDAAAGIYFVGVLYNSSAQTTAPTIGISANYASAALTALDFTNSAKHVSTVASLNALPSSQAMSGTTAVTGKYWVALY